MQKSRLQEEETAKAIGGKRRQGSGSCPWLPQDNWSEKILAQDKFTSKPAIRISRKLLERLEEDALSSGKIPAFIFGFSQGDRVRDNWIAIPLRLTNMFSNPPLWPSNMFSGTGKGFIIKKHILERITSQPDPIFVFWFLNGGDSDESESWIAMPLAYFQKHYLPKIQLDT